MSGAGFNGNEALRSRVLIDVEALGQKFRPVISKGCSVLVHHSYANETDNRRCPERASMGLKPSEAVY